MTKDTRISGRAASLSKLKLLTSGSITAAIILLALAPETALAQAGPSPSGHGVNAEPAITSGFGEFIPSLTIDTVEIDSDQVIIDWTLVDESGTGTVNFLPSENNLVFDRLNGGDYTVLNRIVPTDQTRAIGIDGNVISVSAGETAGNIWFYSPGGIIAGTGANFNVGSLLLTTNAIDTSGGLLGPDGEIRFNGPAGSTSAITIADGVRINAMEDNSYVAMVAPRVVQGGSVTVNGSVGYVAAEQADITINNGLFDINVTVGSESSSGIEHTGTTTGPTRDQSTGVDNQTIYMVAIPKNQAMTMLLSGSIGYTPATGVTLNENDGNIILSAGGNMITPSFIDETIDPARNANISISNADFSNDVTAFANNEIVLDATAGASITAAQGVNTLDMEFTSGDTIRMEAGGGGAIDLDGNVTLNTINGAQIIARQDSSITVGRRFEVNAFSETQGGVIDILASGSGSRVTGSGEIVIGDAFIADAGIIGLSGSDASLEDGLDTFGGTINLDIEAGGLLDINTNGVGQESFFDVSAAPIMGTATAGEATGGTINVNIDGAGSTLTNGGIERLTFDAEGKRGSNFSGSSTGGTNNGGTINFNVTGGIINADSISVFTSATATANGELNGELNTGVSENGANAGNLTANFTDATLNITNSLRFENLATTRPQYDIDGNESDGMATAGILNVTFDNTALNGGSLRLEKDIIGSGTAGDLSLNVINGSNLSLTGDLQLYAESRARSEGTATNSGNINLLVDNASLDALTYNLDTSRTTRAAANASTDGTTGSINVQIQNGGSMTGGYLFAYANARTFVDGGTSTAGDIAVTIDGGTMAIGDGSFTGPSVFLSASGSGYGNEDALASERGLGIGGNITVTLDNGSDFSADSFSSDSSGRIFDDAEGPIPIRGQGGNGIGGLTTFNLNGGSFTVGEMSVSSNGSGSFGGDSRPFGSPEEPGIVGDGGDGQGGDVVFNLGGADVVADTLLISAIGTGGNGGNASDLDGVDAGNAGSGSGGNITINANAGSLTVSDDLTVSVSATGGRGGDGAGVNAGRGGDSVGGTATFNIDGTSSISAPAAIVTANAVGGRGGDALPSDINSSDPPLRAGDGGNAVGGTAAFSNISGDISVSNIEVTAVGMGGDAGNDPDAPERQPDPFGSPIPPAGYVGQTAGNGGSGTGGDATVNLGQDDATNPLYQVKADGIGAKGGEGTSGGDAGDGIGGTASLNITGGNISLDSPQITAEGLGGAGGIARSISGNGGNGGNAQGGTARLDVAGAGTELAITGEPLSVVSNAFGGDGAVGDDNSDGDGGNGGDGGSATAGTTEIAVRTGASFAIDDASYTLASTGTGGQGGNGGSGITTDGQGGDGGQGTGGTARLLAQGGTITGNDVTITTTGQGGSAGSANSLSFSGVNGTGAGGTAIMEVQEGSPGVLTLGNVNMFANGVNGGDDIDATGFAGRIEITDTSTDPAGLITLDSLNAEALAEAGSNSGFFMSGNSGATTVTGDFTVNVAGDVAFTFDGDGQLNVGGSTDIDTPQNFTVTHTNRATGFNSIFSANNLSATVGGNIDASADARLGSDAAITLSAEGSISFHSLYSGSVTNLSAVGGDITGDIASGDSGINATSPGVVTIGSLITQQDPNISVDITGDQGIEVQTLVSGDALLNASAGNIAVRNDANLTGTVFADGLDIFLRSTGDLQARADASAGNIDIAADGNLDISDATATGNILMTASGNITGDLVNGDGGISITSPGLVTIGSLVTQQDPNTSVGITGDQGIEVQTLISGEAFLDASEGNIAVRDDANLTGTVFADGLDIFLRSTGDLQARADASAGNVDIAADGNLNISDATATGNILMTASGNITGDLVNGDGGISITSPGLVTIGSLVTQQDPNTSVGITGDQGIEVQTLVSGDAFLDASEGNIAVRDDANLSGTLFADGQDIFLRSTGDLQTRADASAGNVDIAADGNLNIRGATAAGNILLASTGSTTINQTVMLATAANTVPVPSSGGITGQNLVANGGDITITAATDAVINSDTIAANNLSITAGNLIDIQALALGTSIDLSSADINIGADGQLGTSTQTNNIYIESNGTNQAILGGTGTTGVFSLSEEEFGRIQSSQDLTIFIQATDLTSPDLIIQDLTVTAGNDAAGQAGGTIGSSTGTLTIGSGQSTRVDGDLNLTNAMAETGLTITSVDDLRINANGGVIQITDGNNEFGSVGLLSLFAQNIYAMTDQAFTDIDGLELSEINLRLGDNDGVDLDGGLIRADFAEFFVEEDLFIQNTAPDGDFDSRRGFSVNALTIYGSSSGNSTNIVINGVVDGATGSDTIPATTVEAEYDDASTINGCLIADPTSCSAPPPPPPPPPPPEPEVIPVIDPVQDVIEEEVTSGENGSAITDPLETNLIEFKETEEFINDPLIDEPVTGAGNDDLWIGGNNDGNGPCEEGDTECGPGGSPDEDTPEDVQ